MGEGDDGSFDGGEKVGKWGFIWDEVDGGVDGVAESAGWGIQPADKLYADEWEGVRIRKESYYDGAVKANCYLLESVDDFQKLLETIFEKVMDGWGDFKVEKFSEMRVLGLNDYLAIHFKKGGEWKYIKVMVGGKA